MPETLDMMRAAALDALERLHGVGWHMDLNSFYGPLGETLMWTTALADATGIIEEPRYSGLAYARNCMLHGFVVVSRVHVQKALQPSTLLGGLPSRHAFDAYQWGFGEDPEPYDPTTGKPERTPRRRAHYSEHLAHHVVFPMLDEALLDLGVNVYLVADSPLLPKRAPRRSSVPPDYVPPHD
jgi:hypothetical protein